MFYVHVHLVRFPLLEGTYGEKSAVICEIDDVPEGIRGTTGITGITHTINRFLGEWANNLIVECT